MTPSTASLEAIDVRKTYGPVVALDAVSLSVAPGTSCALVGESGSGKTTLLRTFNRMVRPDDGRVAVGGTDVSRADPVQLRRSVGYVQQEGGLLPHWTIERNAALVPRLNARSDARERAREALNLVGLDPGDFGDRWPRELSGGQRQRAALARALADEPEVLLLDEPFGALDAITRSEVRDTFGALQERLGLTVLLVTHDMREAFHLGDRIAVMREGAIEQSGPAPALRDSPSTPYVRRLLDKAGVS
ncbi:MAG: ATP-binding cassette domain-containing protein [Longimicrobiales bacterium]|nr:ATP-binding cassette domain-containing protein [Longimicrobiales bacterium]